MNEYNLFRYMAKLGVADFETVADVERQQKKFLRNLRSTSIARRHYEGLESCNPTTCGRYDCLEVCRFASFQRRIKHIIAGHRLITSCGDLVFEVCIARGGWIRRCGELDQVSIGAAKKLNRRALDGLHNPNLVAIGTLKVAPANYFNVEELWVVKIHQLVAGADWEAEDIKSVFIPKGWAPRWYDPKYPNVLWVKRVENVGQALSDIFDLRLRSWRDPRDVERQQRNTGETFKNSTLPSFPPAKLTLELWEEYYRWRFALKPRTSLIRYGCDRYWNKLEKEPRLIQAKPQRPFDTRALAMTLTGVVKRWKLWTRLRSPLS